jgi:hypothetical protein
LHWPVGADKRLDDQDWEVIPVVDPRKLLWRERWRGCERRTLVPKPSGRLPCCRAFDEDLRPVIKLYEETVRSR